MGPLVRHLLTLKCSLPYPPRLGNGRSADFKISTGECLGNGALDEEGHLGAKRQPRSRSQPRLCSLCMEQQASSRGHRSPTSGAPLQVPFSPLLRWLWSCIFPAWFVADTQKVCITTFSKFL